MREPSASKLSLLDYCAHPFTSGKKWPWYEDSKAAAKGHAVHFAIAAPRTGEAIFPAALAALTERETDACFAMARQAEDLLVEDAERGRQILGFEIDIRYDVEAGTSRLALDPGEKKRPGEWTAIADLVLRDADGALRVRDWKTGQQKNTEDARENPQIRLLARAAAAHYGARVVVVELAYLEEASSFVDRAAFTRFDLAAIAAEMRARRAIARGGPTPPVPGAHCTEKFCPLLGVCPATLAALASAYPLEQQLTTEIRDADHARFILERLPGAEKALDAISAAVKEYAKTTPIQGADGKVYAWREHSERAVKVETDEHVEALRAVLGERVAEAVETKRVATIGSIERAARMVLADRGEKRGIGKIVDEAFEELVRVGGARMAPYSKPEWFKPKEMQ